MSLVPRSEHAIGFCWTNRQRNKQTNKQRDSVRKPAWKFFQPWMRTTKNPYTMTCLATPHTCHTTRSWKLSIDLLKRAENPATTRYDNGLCLLDLFAMWLQVTSRWAHFLPLQNRLKAHNRKGVVRSKSDARVALNFVPAIQVPGIKMIPQAQISISMFLKH